MQGRARRKQRRQDRGHLYGGEFAIRTGLGLEVGQAHAGLGDVRGGTVDLVADGFVGETPGKGGVGLDLSQPGKERGFAAAAEVSRSIFGQGCFGMGCEPKSIALQQADLSRGGIDQLNRSRGDAVGILEIVVLILVPGGEGTLPDGGGPLISPAANGAATRPAPITNAMARRIFFMAMFLCELRYRRELTRGPVPLTQIYNAGDVIDLPCIPE